MSQTSLKERTAKGLFWGAMNSGTTQVLNLVIGVFLARLLTIFTAIAGDLQSAGFTQALVNIRRPEDRHYNSVFSFNVVMSVIMYALLFFWAPLIASFFHQPCLVSVSRVVFLSFLISSLGIAHGGYMTKNMMNKEIAIIGALALIVSGSVGITLALLGFSYWSLAWQQIAYITTLNLGRYYYVSWRPRLTLDFAPVRQMAFPMPQVGNYSQAFKWDTMAHSLITNTVGQLAQPVLVESSDNQLRVYRKMIRFTAFLSMPLMFGLALVSREFILITIGSAWLGCVPLLQLLCLSGAFMPLHTMYQNLAISNGRSDIFMWLNILQIILQVTLIILIAPYGMYLMVAAYSLFIFLWLLPWHLFTGRLIAYSWWEAFKDVAPFVLLSLAVMLLTWFITQPILNIWLLLLAKVLIATLLYYAIMKLLHVQILRECEAFFKSQLHR